MLLSQETESRSLAYLIILLYCFVYSISLISFSACSDLIKAGGPMGLDWTIKVKNGIAACALVVTIIPFIALVIRPNSSWEAYLFAPIFGTVGHWVVYGFFYYIVDSRLLITSPEKDGEEEADERTKFLT